MSSPVFARDPVLKYRRDRDLNLPLSASLVNRKDVNTAKFSSARFYELRVKIMLNCASLENCIIDKDKRA